MNLEVKAIKSVANMEKRPLGLRQIYLLPTLALMALATFLAARAWQLVGGHPEIGGGTILLRLLAWSVLFLAFSLLISWLSQRLALQLKLVAQAVERVAAGHYQERVPVQGSREMRQLASAFNHMAEPWGIAGSER